MATVPDMQILQNCLDKLLERLKVTLDFSTPPVSEEYAYQSLPLCVLDAIFSINAKYESTRKVVIRYCDHYGLQKVRKDPNTLPPIEDQESLSAFIGKINALGVEEFAKTVLANRQRTSTRKGILKSEAVLRFAQVLQAHKVEYLQDFGTIQGNESFEKAIKEIPGQGSGITIRYFYMLAGSDDFVKPDRMILGFLKEQTGRSCNPDQAQELLSRAANALRNEYPYMTPKLLDNLIWMYQREKGRKESRKAGTSKVEYASKQDLDMLKKLIVEFKSELDVLGVKVDELEVRQSLLTEVPGLVRRDIPPAAESGGKSHDVFISHASEDKDEIVRPLANALVARGLDVWYDEFSLRIGDSLRGKIDQGLARSRIGLVVLSPSFLSKGWPQYELEGIVTRAVSGEQVLLPIWHNLTKQQVIDFSPSLADKVARSTATSTVEEIADEIAGVLRHINNQVRTRSD